MCVVGFVASGATCHHNRIAVDPNAPAAFINAPTLADVIYAVNANTDRIQHLHTDSASLSAAGLPALRASLDVERPHRLRMRAKLLGPEIDLGSNEELFWFWARSGPEPAVYYASHRDYAAAPVRALMPVDPHWFMEALGLVALEPGGFHEGPYPQGEGRVEVRSRLPSPQGELTRVLVIDNRYGWVLEQHLYAPHGQLLTTARASAHRFYPQAAASLPHLIEIEMPPAQLAFRIDVSQYDVNQSPGDASQLWTMPYLEGYTPVNIASPQFALPHGPPASGTGLTNPLYRQSRADVFPPYRGYAPLR